MRLVKLVLMGLLMLCVTAGTMLVRQWPVRPWKDVNGIPNTSMLGSQFGSIGQDKIVSFDGVVGEVKADGFVAIVAPPDHPPMLIGAINPEGNAPDLKVGDSVRVEVRWYRIEVGDGNPKKIFIVTKRIEK